MVEKCKKGYTEFVTPDGLRCYIKISRKVNLQNQSGKYVVKFRYSNDTTWNYHIPDKEFNTVLEVVKFIIDNATNDGNHYKIYKSM